MIRLISRICVIGITIGVAAFVVVLSIMNGFNGSIKKRYLSVEPHLVVYSSGEIEENKIRQAVDDIFIETRVDVESFYPFHVQDVFLKGPEGFSGAVAKGLSRSELKKLFQRVIDSRRQLSAQRDNTEPTSSEMDEDLGELTDESLPDMAEVVDRLQPGEVIMGMELARSMGIYEGDILDVMPPEALLLPLGEVPDKEQVSVKALFNVDVSEVDSRYMYYIVDETLMTIKHPASLRQGYELRLSRPEEFKAVYSVLEKRFEDVETWVDRNAALFLALKVEKITMTVFMSLSGLITCFTIITILILLITQKRADVGILMTLGLSPIKAQRLFQWIGGFLFGVGLMGASVGRRNQLVFAVLPARSATRNLL
ncbi:MAG: hypothetical protein R2827_02440 [Bdellovibrionales bacterium]